MSLHSVILSRRGAGAGAGASFSAHKKTPQRLF